MKRVILFFLITLALIPPGASQPSVTIIAPAVEKTPQGLHGVLSSVTVVAQKGSGHVYIDTWPLAQVDIQGSARLAVQVASDVVNKDWREYDFFITVRSDSPIIGGPSAGGAMTVALIAALQGWTLNPDVIMTGTINPDETVGPVGGVYQKAQAASEVADLFLVPEGQTTLLVEEQEMVQGVPFIYTTTKKEIDLVEEGKKIGLEVKEVYDIRDAVFYFTGKRIELPQIKGEPITTDFMKPYAEEKLDTIENEYRTVLTRVGSYTGQYKKNLEANLSSAKKQIDYGRDAYNRGNYYTSVSSSFTAGVYITYTVNLLSYFEGTSPDELFPGLSDALVRVSEEARAERAFGMTALQYIAVAQRHIFEAKTYFEQAQNETTISGYLEYASYAQRRTESAEFLLDMSRKFEKGDEITQDVLKDAASSMVSTASLSLVYASSILPQNDLLQEAADSLNKGEEEFMDEVYAGALSFALESKVYSEVALVTYSSTEETMTARVERAREKAKAAIELSRKRGIEPALAVSYYELSESITDPVQALIHLGYAEEVASISTYIESQPEIPVVTSESETPVESLKPGVLLTETGRWLLFLVVGICVGVALSWVVRKVTGWTKDV